MTSGILELLLYPVIYVFWRKRHLGTSLAQPEAAALSVATTFPMEFAPPGVSAQSKPVPTALTTEATRPSHRPRPWLVIVLLLVIATAAGGFFAWQRFGRGESSGPNSGASFVTQKVKDLTVNLIHPKGQLQNAMNEILIEFRDTTSGELVDVGTVKFDLDMNMPGMVMHSGSTIQPTGTPGLYKANVKPDMAGDWMATLRYEGPRGNGSVSFSVNVKQ